VSVHKTDRGYVVRWREGTRNRQRTFDRKGDADTWHGEVRRRRQLGTLAQLNEGSVTLDEYVTETWVPVYAILLAPRTRESYAQAYDKHVAPGLGHRPLHSITPPVISRWQSSERASGHAALAKARSVLSSILQTAIEGGLLATNPVRQVRAPKVPLREEVRPFAPSAVEKLRAELSQRDAVMVSLMAYAGLRPGELRTLR
jgi:integrase